LRTNDFYVTGESYAGKYVPAIAYKIHTEKQSNISLKGIAIGDGLTDPETMFDYGDYLYQIGLIDEKQRQYFIQQQNKAISFIRREMYVEAYEIFDPLLLGAVNKETYFKNVTGLLNYYNILRTNDPEDQAYYKNFLSLSNVRKSIHVGNLTFNDMSKNVFIHLIHDLGKSVKPWFTVLMDNYRVLVYSGQLDVIVAAPLTENFLRSVQWKHRDEYLNADRKIWKVDESDKEVAG
ncbi:putative serine carboxypeptidase CPVL-like protein, partial [Leptotrombidium deliense]